MPANHTATALEPPDHDLHARLVRALKQFVEESGPRVRVPGMLRIGTPAGAHLGFGDHPGYDAGLRADVLERALDGFDPDAPAPTVWLTRSGALSPGDLDFAWLAAAREAFGRHQLRLAGFYVLTRTGWNDLLSDSGVVEVRVRRRRRRPGKNAVTPPRRSPRVHGLVAVHPLAVVEQRQA